MYLKSHGRLRAVSEQSASLPDLQPSTDTLPSLLLCSNPSKDGVRDAQGWWNSCWNYWSELRTQSRKAWKALQVILIATMSKISPGQCLTLRQKKMVRRAGGSTWQPQAGSPDIPKFGSGPHSFSICQDARLSEPLQQGCFTPAFWPPGRPSLLLHGSRESVVGASASRTYPPPGLRPISWAALTIWVLVLNTLVQWECLTSWSQNLLLGVLMKTWSFSAGWILAQEVPGNIKMSSGLACS